MKTEISISHIGIKSLYANTWNTNHVSPENKERIRKSIERFDMFRPILVREIKGKDGYEILGGQHRWEVASEMGLETVPVINLGFISDKRAKEIGLVDNGRYGEDDTLALSALLQELDLDDVALFMPYSDDELFNIVSSANIALEELEIEDSDEQPAKLPEKQVQTHAIVRFKIPIEDLSFIQSIIERTEKTQGFTDDDSMTNAGNALIHIIREIKNA